jgi:putative PIG3 family NAD(P)H quinone oxidoreductase
MRAIVIPESGEPEVMEIRDVATPEPGPGEIRVRVRAFGINRADLLQRRGMYPAPPGVPPDIPGMEYAGEVDAVGTGCKDIIVGAQVMGIVGGGGYAEFLVTPHTHATPIPQGLSFPEAAGIPEVFITAHDALERLAVSAGEWVLVHAVGSGVGTAAVQLIEMRGALSVGTSRTRAKLERAAELGMHAGIDTSSEDLCSAIKRITGKGAHAAMDLIGGALFPVTLEAMAPRGRVILVGLTAGRTAELNLGVVLSKRLRIEGTVLRPRTIEEKTDAVRAFSGAVLPLFEARQLRPVIDRVFPFAQTSDAHRYMESNANVGKIVVEMT